MVRKSHSQKYLPGMKVHWAHRYAHGGSLRNKRAGRKERVVSTKDPIHLVLKCNRETVPGGLRIPKRFKLIHELCDRYLKRFVVTIEQISIQGDHIHIVLRTTRRSGLQGFLRVFSGQIAQRFQHQGLMLFEVPAGAGAARTVHATKVTGTPRKAQGGEKSSVKVRVPLWKYRPFTRVVKGYRAYLNVKDYVQMNEKEAQRVIPYRQERLRRLTRDEYEALWV